MNLPRKIKISILLMIISSPPKREVQRPESPQYGNKALFLASVCAIINDKVILINERSFSFMKRTILLMFLVLLLMGGCKDIKNNQDLDRKSTRLNSSHVAISYAVFCLKKKNI